VSIQLLSCAIRMAAPQEVKRLSRFVQATRITKLSEKLPLNHGAPQTATKPCTQCYHSTDAWTLRNYNKIPDKLTDFPRKIYF
jgi:hypothetical protein